MASSKRKMRWRVWRARCSIPTLLATHDERKVVSIVAAVNGALAILVIGCAAWLTDLPMVFPVLGPTAFILFSKPLAPDAAPRSVILGHLLGMACGLASWLLCETLIGPVSLAAGGWAAYCSASLALALMCLCLIQMSCPHPPACGTALVVALGVVVDGFELLIMALTVCVLTLQAVLMNRLVGVKMPAWSQTIDPS